MWFFTSCPEMSPKVSWTPYRHSFSQLCLLRIPSCIYICRSHGDFHKFHLGKCQDLMHIHLYLHHQKVQSQWHSKTDIKWKQHKAVQHAQWPWDFSVGSLGREYFFLPTVRWVTSPPTWSCDHQITHHPESSWRWQCVGWSEHQDEGRGYTGCKSLTWHHLFPLPSASHPASTVITSCPCFKFLSSTISSN